MIEKLWRFGAPNRRRARIAFTLMYLAAVALRRLLLRHAGTTASRKGQGLAAVPHPCSPRAALPRALSIVIADRRQKRREGVAAVFALDLQLAGYARGRPPVFCVNRITTTNWRSLGTTLSQRYHRVSGNVGQEVFRTISKGFIDVNVRLLWRAEVPFRQGRLAALLLCPCADGWDKAKGGQARARSGSARSLAAGGKRELRRKALRPTHLSARG